MKLNYLKFSAKFFLKSLLYKFPPIFLAPSSLYVWLDMLVKTKELKGDVVEVGCYLGGTAVMSARMLKSIGSNREYIVLDTFSGFAEDQFESELKAGGARFLRNEFSGNTPALARWVMNKHGGQGIKMVQGDICTLPDSQIPQNITACLLDVDLVDPIYIGLCRLYPKLVEGGMIAVDDCDDATYYKAKLGYRRFVEEHGLPFDIRHGMGIVEKRSPAPVS